MKTFKRICLKDFTVVDEMGTSFTIKRGKEYITSAVNEAPAIGPHPRKDHVIVFSDYWVHIPIDIFGGEVEFTK